MKNSKKGSAIALAVIFATVLLTMGLAYAKLTNNNKKQTVQIDERVKLQYLAHSITELALLKFQMYPADYYACSDAASLSYPLPLAQFAASATEFVNFKDDISKSSYSDNSINIQLGTMRILTDNKYKNEVLFIEASASCIDSSGKTLNKTVRRLVDLNRKTVIPGS